MYCCSLSQHKASGKLPHLLELPKGIRIDKGRFARETLTSLKPTLNLKKLPLLIFVNKGIEIGTQALTLDIIADTCGPEVAKISTFIVRLPSIFRMKT